MEVTIEKVSKHLEVSVSNEDIKALCEHLTIDNMRSKGKYLRR